MFLASRPPPSPSNSLATSGPWVVVGLCLWLWLGLWLCLGVRVKVMIMVMVRCHPGAKPRHLPQSLAIRHRSRRRLMRPLLHCFLPMTCWRLVRSTQELAGQPPYPSVAIDFYIYMDAEYYQLTTNVGKNCVYGRFFTRVCPHISQAHFRQCRTFEGTFP